MRALVIFESMFGNTESVARAVASGLGAGMEVDVLEVGTAPAAIPGDVDLLVIGGPTHAFGMSRPRTRADAAGQAPGGIVSRGIGMREWLESLHAPATAPAAATFDTRIDKPRVPGSAARGAEKRLRKLGFRMLADAESFYVRGTPGPLVDGEVVRARRWGEALAAAARRPEPMITA